MSFNVNHHLYGIVINGVITVSELTGLLASWDTDGIYDTVDLELGKHFGGIVISTEDDVVMWKKELERQRLKVVNDDEETTGPEHIGGEGEGSDS